jgi:hypothetical protein
LAFIANNTNSEKFNCTLTKVGQSVVKLIRIANWSADFKRDVVVLISGALNADSIDSVVGGSTIAGSGAWIVDFVGLADNKVAQTAFQG